MIWTIVSVPSTYTFLTADRPIVMTNGLSRPDSRLAIPIGPRKLFIASNEQAIVDHVVAWKPDDLVSFVNNRVFCKHAAFALGPMTVSFGSWQIGLAHNCLVLQQR